MAVEDSVKPSLTTRELVSNEYCRVFHDPQTNVVRFIRTGASIRSLEEAARHFGQAVSIINALGRNRLQLILDMREAPMRNDPLFEAAMAEHRREVARDIPVIVLIAKTAVGRLHAQRLGKADHVHQAIVATEEEALAFLAQVGPPTRRAR